MRGRLWHLALYIFVLGFILNLLGIVTHVTAVGMRADLASVGRGRHRLDSAHQTAAAQVSNLAVPGAQSDGTARTAILRARGQSDT